MNCQVYINGEQLPLSSGCLYFKGYINYHGNLLYDVQAGIVLKDLLQTQSLDDMLKEINGSFWFVYLKEQTLNFSIDHFGGASLFYSYNDGTLCIMDNPMQAPFKTQVNDKALCSLFACGFTQNDDTLFNEIKECTPGTLYGFDLLAGLLTLKVWYSYYSSNSKAFDADELDAIVNTLFPPIKDSKYTVSLSGGIDSRFLVGCLLKKELDFQAYSFGSKTNKDKQIAQELAAQLGFSFQNHDFNPETCQKYFTPHDTEYILRNCTLGRSLPNETDLISSDILYSQTDVIVKGFCGDGLAGSLITDEALKISSFKAMTDCIYHKYFNLTGKSAKSYENVLYAQLAATLKTQFSKNQHSFISTLEEWHLFHKQRKYVVNTLAFYKARGFRYYLPFYDRNLMNFFAQLHFSEKHGQKAYFTFLRERFFTGKLACLKDTISSRINFLSTKELSLQDKFKTSIQHLVRDTDTKNLRKRYQTPNSLVYADSLMLFNQDSTPLPFLRHTIGENYPEIYKVRDFLNQQGCPEAAKHLNLLSSQQTSQISINGISLARFFFTQEFITVLQEHSPN